MNENQVLIKRMSSLRKVALCYSLFNEQTKIALFAGYGEQKILSYYGGIKKLKIWYGITKSMKNFTVL